MEWVDYLRHRIHEGCATTRRRSATFGRRVKAMAAAARVVAAGLVAVGRTGGGEGHASHATGEGEELLLRASIPQRLLGG